MKYQAILFDLDGTLLDTLEDLADSMNAALAGFGFPLHPVASYKQFVGTGIKNLVHKALPEGARDDNTITNMVEAMTEEYGKRWDKKTQPYEGIPEMLHQLQHLGIRLSILSNKPHAFTVQVVKKKLLDFLFDYVLGDRQGVPRKPNPASALEIARLMHVPVTCFLYVGDSDTDMETAKAANMYPVGVAWGFRKPEELIKAGAKSILRKPADLFELL